MKFLLLASTSAVCMIATVPASAQQTGGAGETPVSAASASVESEPQGTPAATDDAAQQEQGGLEDIIVTAQRRSENLQRAAIPVSAVSGDSLIASGISETSALSRLVPSLQVQSSGGSGTSFFLRGVGTLQANAFGENPIAFNFNGVYIARPNAPVGTFYDLERLEVVKGPQGTLYGRNATGGAINVLPKKPELGEFGGDMTLEYGNYDAKKGSAALNVPIGDHAAIRVAGQLVDRDGYLSDGYSDEKGQAARASLLFKPDGGWSATFVADYFHLGGKGAGSVLAPGSAFGNPSGFSYPGYAAPALKDYIGSADPRSIAALAASPPPAAGFLANGFVVPPKTDGFNDSSYYGVSATIEGDLGLGTLTVLPAYRRSETNYRTYLPGFRGDVTEASDQQSLEVRLASNGQGSLGYVLGAYYFVEDQKAANSFFQGAISTVAFQPNITTESKAIFGQFSYALAPTFRLIAGGRYTEEKKDLTASNQSLSPFGPPVVTNVKSNLDFSKFTWKAGVEADLGPQSLLYANVATGFKAGGFFVGSVNNTYRPESITAYTVGSKNRFFDKRLQFNVEGYYWAYKDQQISFVGPVQVAPGIFSGGLTTVNAGKARFFGVEAEMVFAPTKSDTFSLNLLYNDAKETTLRFVAISSGGTPLRTGCPVQNNTSLPVAPPNRLFEVNCSGMPGISAPKWSGTVGYEHSFTLPSDFDLVFGVRSRVSSGYYTALDYLPEQREDGYTQTDLHLTLNGPQKRWSLTGFVNNVEDSAVINGSVLRPVLQTVYAVLGAPRTYGIRAGVRF